MFVDELAKQLMFLFCKSEVDLKLCPISYDPYFSD